MLGTVEWSSYLKCKAKSILGTEKIMQTCLPPFTNTVIPKYKAVNTEIKKNMQKAKENWIEEQYQPIEENLKKSLQKVYQVLKELTKSIKVEPWSTSRLKKGNV